MDKQAEIFEKDERQYRVSVLQNSHALMHYDVIGANAAYRHAERYAGHAPALPDAGGDLVRFVDLATGITVRAYVLTAEIEAAEQQALLLHYGEVVRGVEQKAINVKTVTTALGCGLLHALPTPKLEGPVIEAGLWAVVWNELDRLRFGDLADRPVRIVEVSGSGKTVKFEREVRALVSKIAGTFRTKEEAEQVIEHVKMTQVMVNVVDRARQSDLIHQLNGSKERLLSDRALKTAA